MKVNFFFFTTQKSIDTGKMQYREQKAAFFSVKYTLRDTIMGCCYTNVIPKVVTIPIEVSQVGDRR